MIDRRPIFTLRIALIGIAAALVLLLYGYQGNMEEVATQGKSAILWMISRWNWAGADMAHGWLVPLVSLYAIWRKWPNLREMPRMVSWAGVIPVILFLLLYLAGLRVQQTRLVLMSLIGLLWSIPLFLFGRSVARGLAFPCGYLVFCIPFTFIDGMTLPLRLMSTAVSSGVLNGLGIPVTRIGTAIQVHAGAGFALDVAHPCSGLRYLVAMVALTTAYAFLTPRSGRDRILLCLSSIPIAMAGNMVRIIMIAVVGVFFGSEIAVGFYHDYSGYVVFAVAILLMIGLSNLLDRSCRKKEHGPS